MAARDLRAWVASRRHPRLVATVAVGLVVVLVGLVLDSLGGPLGSRLALLGALVLAYGASGYAAFWVFERTR